MSCITETQYGIYPINSIDVEMPVVGISVMTSLGCNLKCDYCLINKALKNNEEYARTMQKNTIQALKDGSFRKNARRSLICMKESPNNIQRIELWGQEQILTLDYFIDDIDGWLDDFPNWTTLFFSTNGQTGADKIIRLIKALENSGRGMHFSLQWSYDGSYSSQHIRHDTDIKVIQTLSSVLEQLNDIRLENLTIDMYLHGVVSFQLIKELGGDINKIKEYWDDAAAEAKKLWKINRNKNVNIPMDFSIAEEIPYACSVEEALAYHDFLVKSATIEGNLSGLNYLSNQWSAIATMMLGDDRRQYTLDEVTEWLNDKLNKSDVDWEEFELLTTKMSNGYYCGNGVSEYKILYDGTLVNCQNSIFDTIEDSIDSEKNISNEVRRHWIRKGLFLKPDEATEEEKEKYKYIWRTAKSKTFWHTWNNTFNLLYYLTAANQTSPLYKGKLKNIINHAYIISYINQCHFNNATMTGSMWTKDTGIIRRYANGFAYYMEEDENNMRKNSNMILKGDNLHGRRHY